MIRISKNIFGGPFILVIWSFITLGMFYPAYWTASIGFTPSMLLYVISLFCWASLFIINKMKFHSLSKIYNQLYLLFFIYFTARLIFFFNVEYVIRLIQLTVFYVTTFLVYNSFYINKNFIKYFTYWNILMLLLTLIGLITFYTIGLPPIGEVAIGGATGTGKLVNYGLFFIKVHVDVINADVISFLRPAGYYDEPGSFAYVITFLLLYNKLYTKNRIVEIVLLFGGLILLSMAYYAVFFCYIFLFYFNRKIMILLLVLAILVFTLFDGFEPEKGTFIYYFYDKIIDRFFEIIEGNDPSRNFSDALQAFKKHILFGAPTNVLSSEFPNATHETIWFFLAQNGLLGGMFLLLSPFLFILYIHKTNRSLYIKSICIILLLWIQRPDYLNPLYLTLLYFLYFAPKVECNRKIESVPQNLCKG